MGNGLSSIIASDALSLSARSDTTAPTERPSEGTTTSDTGQPIYMTDPDALDPWAEVEPLNTWVEIGGRPAFPTAGLISISAKRKQGKSLAISALAIPLLTGKEFGNVVPLMRPKRLILFDTEMDSRTLQGRLQALLRQVGKDNPALAVFPILSKDRDTRLEFIKSKVDKYSPDLVVLDGVADLMTDINDYKEAATLLEEVMKLAEKRTVICVLHQNKALTDEAMRGHLGTCLGNKAIENYSMKRAGRTFELSCVDSRTTGTDDAPTFKFAVDTNGNIISTETIFAEAEERRRADMAEEFAALFGEASTLTYTDMVQAIEKKYQLKDRAAKNKVEEAKKMEVIKKISSDRAAPYRFVGAP